MTPELAAYVEAYISFTRMDDPARLVPSDLEIGAGWLLTPEEREEACAALRLRSAEFKRISPEEECREVARVMQAVSAWAYKRARQEDSKSHPFPNEDGPDAWPSCLSVRKGSALGSALLTALQLSNTVHVSESCLRAGVGLRRTLEKLGVTDAMLHATFYGLNNASATYRWWGPADEAAADALAARVRGTSDVPPNIADRMIRFPSIWKTHARDMRVVWARDFKKYPRDFKIEQLKSGWTPEMVLALHDLWNTRQKVARHQEDTEETARLTGISSILRTFLLGRGILDLDKILASME